MTQRPKDGLMNLADMMVEDILGMSDEEVLAEATPEELAEAAKVRDQVLGLLDKWQRDADGECAPPNKEG